MGPDPSHRMRELLFLTHRIPFPPNKGDKIRSFHILRHLSQSFRVHLGTFIDDPEDWRYVDNVHRFCGETCILPLNPTWGKFRSLKGFFTGQALTLPYYNRPALRAWVKRIVQERPLAGVLVFSSAMAQYVADYPNLRRIIDFVDVDSDKWRQYATRKSFPLNWVYAREGKRLLAHDRDIAMHFTRSLLVSTEEAELFRRLAPEVADKVEALENGVDVDFFNPNLDLSNPYPVDSEVLVFTGAMDYWANVDAVCWFADAVFRAVRARRPNARFFVVGARPTQAVLELSRMQGVEVTGSVPDVRPYLKYAHLAVAPLRIARGIQNKVLEAMAMNKPVLASKGAVEGIAVEPGLDLEVAETAEEWVRRVEWWLAQPATQSSANRDFVVERYGWARSLGRLDGFWHTNGSS